MSWARRRPVLPSSFLTVSAALLFGAGCGGSTAPEGGAAGPNSIVWTVRTSAATTKWVGASFSAGCFQEPKFQAYADATSTAPSGNIAFVAAAVLADWPRVGGFQLSDSAGAIGARVLVDAGATAYAPDEAAPGTLTVETYDSSTQVLTGTFQFDSVATAGGQFQAGSVTGSFNFPCLN